MNPVVHFEMLYDDWSRSIPSTSTFWSSAGRTGPASKRLANLTGRRSPIWRQCRPHDPTQGAV